MNAMTFPFNAIGTAVADVAPDKSTLVASRLAAAIAKIIPGVSLTAQLGGAVYESEQLTVAMLRSDGLRCAVTVSPQLAEALASLSLGGSFTAEATRPDALTPSERCAQRSLVTACLDVIDSLWPAEPASWQVATGAVSGTEHAVEITAADLRSQILLVIAPADPAKIAQPTGTPRAEIAWSRGMRALLGATGLPVRAVLHERQMPLQQAVQLAPGDVLPIEAPRDVQLRIGTHNFARGTVAPLGDDGALLVTIISRRPDPAMLASHEEQP